MITLKKDYIKNIATSLYCNPQTLRAVFCAAFFLFVSDVDLALIG
jgi:hypothetical protein